MAARVSCTGAVETGTLAHVGVGTEGSTCEDCGLLRMTVSFPEGDLAPVLIPRALPGRDFKGDLLSLTIGRFDFKVGLLVGDLPPPTLLVAQVSEAMGFSAILERSLLSELLRRSLGVSGSPLALPFKNSCLVAFALKLANVTLLSSLSFTAKGFLRALAASIPRTLSMLPGHLGDRGLESRDEQGRGFDRGPLGLESRPLCVASEKGCVVRAAMRSLLDGLVLALLSFSKGLETPTS